MRNPMLITEKEYPIPQAVTEWADTHSVPIFRFSSDDREYPELNYDYIVEYSDDISLDYLEIIYCHAHNLPATIGITEDLIIREIGLNDLDAYRKLIEMYPNAVADQTLIGLTREDFKERQKAYIKYSYHFLGYGIYGIFLKISNSEMFSTSREKLIGIAGLDGTDIPSLSYALIKEYQGNGYAFEACCQILEYAGSVLCLDKIIVKIQNDNLRSLHLADKLKEKYPILEICRLPAHSSDQ